MLVMCLSRGNRAWCKAPQMGTNGHMLWQLFKPVSPHLRDSPRRRCPSRAILSTCQFVDMPAWHTTPSHPCSVALLGTLTARLQPRPLLACLLFLGKVTKAKLRSDTHTRRRISPHTKLHTDERTPKGGGVPPISHNSMTAPRPRSCSEFPPGLKCIPGCCTQSASEKWAQSTGSDLASDN